MPPDPKKVKKLEADIKDREGRIEQTQKLAKKWGKLTGPMTPKDEQVLASGAHGTHGKVSYEKAVETLEENITQAKKEVEKVKKELEAEKKKK
jgi:hypothetical protein